MQPITATLPAFSPDSTIESSLLEFGNTSDIDLIQEPGKLFTIAIPFQAAIQSTIPGNLEDNRQSDSESSEQNILAGGEIAALLVIDNSFWNQEISLPLETQEANFMMAASVPLSMPVTISSRPPIISHPTIPIPVIPPPRTIKIGGQTIVINNFSGELINDETRRQVHQAVDMLFAAVKSQNQGELLNNPVVRFSNQNVPGTHFYSASVDEITNVILNYSQFRLDGVAFLVGLEPGDDLLAVHRFSNQSVPGTHFYTASEAEYQNVLANYSQFKYDGIAYYVADTAMNLGSDVYRFSNQWVPGTHFYTASQAEYQNILANYPQFNYDGIAYEVNIL